jgi:hypothetical protein
VSVAPYVAAAYLAVLGLFGVWATIMMRHTRRRRRQLDELERR